MPLEDPISIEYISKHAYSGCIMGHTEEITSRNLMDLNYISFHKKENAEPFRTKCPGLMHGNTLSL